MAILLMFLAIANATYF